MAKNNKNPAIRFKGFTEDWEECDLNDKTIKIGDGLHGTPKYVKNGDVYFINGNNLRLGNVIIDSETKQVTENQVSENDKSLNSNTILISINGTIGNLALYKGENIMLGKSVGFITLKDMNKIYAYFLLQSPKIQNYFFENLTGSTIKNLGLKTIRETKINLPKNPTEQKKIGTFFQNLDSLITQHQKKHDKLVILKKAMLNKMFPKNGAKVPEIRFKGFTEDWVEKPFGEFALVKRGLTYSPKDVSDKGVKVLRSSNIYEGSFIQNKDDVYVKEEAINIELAKNNDILITSANGSSRLVGKHAVIKNLNSKTVHGGFMLIVRTSKPFFLNASMSSSWYSKFINQNVLGGNGAIGNLKSNDLEEHYILIPKEDEQQKIGDYFKNLDKQIALHQTQLNKLNNIKKACLSKMFVSQE